MKTKPIALAFVAALSTLNFQPSTASAQGSLTPSGAPAPVFKTLAQIEPRTAISSVPFTISAPGSYYLTTNLTTTVSNAIVIAANGVTLDLSGFTISSTVANAAQGGAGVLLSGSRTNITILNGFIGGTVTESGGVFSGGGFDSGIFFVIDSNNTNTFGFPFNVRVSGVSVSGCLNYGIGLGRFGTIVESCTVRTAGAGGIFAEIIKNCSATDCGQAGISGYEVTDCRGESVNSGSGISAFYSAHNCYGSSVSGTGVNASQTAENCTGSTVSGDYGLYTELAQNCYGYSVNTTGLRATSSAVNCSGYGFTTGLYADAAAENCYGRASTNGTGLLCYRSANNCSGYCSAGNSSFSYGLFASVANNCYGQHDGSGLGLHADVAIGCNGRCYGNNYGITASILNSCIYYRQTGTPGFSGTKYNMP